MLRCITTEKVSFTPPPSCPQPPAGLEISSVLLRFSVIRDDKQRVSALLLRSCDLTVPTTIIAVSWYVLGEIYPTFLQISWSYSYNWPGIGRLTNTKVRAHLTPSDFSLHIYPPVHGARGKLMLTVLSKPVPCANFTASLNRIFKHALLSNRRARPSFSVADSEARTPSAELCSRPRH